MEEDIKTAIQEELAQIPESFLGLVLALLRAFRINLPVGSQNGFPQPSLSLLQNYADKFRKGFDFFFKESTTWNVSYGYLKNQLTYLHFQACQQADLETKIHLSSLDLMVLLQEHHTDLGEVEEKIKGEGKVILYLEESFIILKNQEQVSWSLEKASEDCREELGKILSELP